MRNTYSIAAHWSQGLDEAGLKAWATDLRRQLEPGKAALGLVFMSPKFFPHAAEVLELLRLHAQVPVLAGCSGTSLIAGNEEVEDHPGLALGLYALPGAELRTFHFKQEQVEEASSPAYWHLETGAQPHDINGWLVFADPFTLDSETWLRTWNEAYPALPVVGGLASGHPAEQRTQVYLNDQVFEEGGIAISIGGAVTLASMISQGCTPIGDTWTITKAERNLIYEIANRPAYEVLLETFAGLSPAERQKAQGNLFAGLVVNEYLDEFHRGDFLIRNLIGADPNSGILAVGAWPRPGQTIQFQRRDAATGTEDITDLLRRTQTQLARRSVYGGCLCSCNGRGQRLFGAPSHDIRHVQQTLGPIGVAGFFCNGEIGPVGEKNFLHGYTASLGLFVNKETA